MIHSFCSFVFFKLKVQIFLPLSDFYTQDLLALYYFKLISTLMLNIKNILIQRTLCGMRLKPSWGR